MSTLRFLGFVSIFGSALTLVACDGSGDGSGGVTFETKTPEERVDAVDQGVEKPSGDVNSAHAQIVLERSRSQAQFDAMGSFLAGIPGFSPLEGTSKCLIEANSEGVVDVSCSSDGKASGKIDYTVSSSANQQLVEMTMTDVCEGGTCLNGSLIVSVKTAKGEVSTIIQGSLDSTTDGETQHNEWGISAKVSVIGSSSERVVFDEDGHSYLVSSSVGNADASGEVTITGANGVFSCSYDQGGHTGSCSGSASFTW